MDLFDFLNTPIDELYERGILQEPEPERNILMCTLVATCSVCTNTYREDYRRQNVDRLIASWHCPECHTPYSYKLISVTPYTTHYRSRNVHRASMRDDTSGQCWQCGYAGGRLLPYTFSCGEHISLCPDHFKRYHRAMYKLAQERASQEPEPAPAPAPEPARQESESQGGACYNEEWNCTHCNTALCFCGSCHNEKCSIRSTTCQLGLYSPEERGNHE